MASSITNPSIADARDPSSCIAESSHYVTFLRLGRMGRLGNQLFQISATIGVAIKNNVPFIFPKWRYAHRFKNSLPQAYHSVLTIDDRIVQPSFEYSYIPYTGGRIGLQGYFQSERFFSHCESSIRRCFEPGDQLQRELDARKHIYEGDTCSIHVRRTDYLRQRQRYHQVGISYYRNAIHFVGESKRYVVFSDDVAWCRQVLPQSMPQVQFTFVNTRKPLLEIFLMSKCSSHIITNSTFGWWGAWLDDSPDKLVIAPNKWFGPALSSNHEGDLIPPNWIKVK